MIDMRPRGTALILAIFFLGFCQLLAMGFTGLIPTELNATKRYALDQASSLTADAGVQYAVAFLEQKLERGEEPVPGPIDRIVLRSHPLGLDLNGWEWEVTVIPDDQTPPNGTNPRRAYSLESVASYDGSVYRKVSAQLIQQSFVRYARFSNHWGPVVSSWAGAQHFTGPVHSNEIIRVAIHAGFYTGSEPILFQDQVTSVQGIEYSSESTEPPPANAAQMQRLYNRNSEPGTRGRIEVPWNTAGMLSQAARGTGPVTGVLTANPGGGIYIDGDVTEMRLAVEGGHPVQYITVAGDTYRVEERPNRTVVTNQSTGASVADHAGPPNGVIYATGNIQGLQGFNRGRHTIAVDSSTQKKIQVAGNLMQAGTNQASLPGDLDNANGLGLIGHKIEIPHSLDPGSVPAPGLTIHAAIMAGDGSGNGGGLSSEGLDAWPRDGTHHNYLHIIGSIVEDTRNITAYIGPGSGWTTSADFDPSLKEAPPPYFPSEPEFDMKGYSDRYEQGL